MTKPSSLENGRPDDGMTGSGRIGVVPNGACFQELRHQSLPAVCVVCGVMDFESLIVP